jgi:hypothetical protein
MVGRDAHNLPLHRSAPGIELGLYYTTLVPPGVGAVCPGGYNCAGSGEGTGMDRYAYV